MFSHVCRPAWEGVCKLISDGQKSEKEQTVTQQYDNRNLFIVLQFLIIFSSKQGY